MSDAYTRRDFLKLAGLLSLKVAAPSLTSGIQQLPQTQTDKKNVIVIVFDAFSAFHLSLYGYERETTPTIARIAERGVVYHNHFSGMFHHTGHRIAADRCPSLETSRLQILYLCKR